MVRFARIIMYFSIETGRIFEGRNLAKFQGIRIISCVLNKRIEKLCTSSEYSFVATFEQPIALNRTVNCKWCVLGHSWALISCTFGHLVQPWPHFCTCTKSLKLNFFTPLEIGGRIPHGEFASISCTI